MNTLSRQLLLTQILASALLLAATATCVAGSYKWTDHEGTLHFSDSPPAGEIRRASLDPADPEQRPLLGKPLVVYRDNVFTLKLTKETDDLLQFDLAYTNIQRSFPDVVSGAPRVQLCAITSEPFYSYLAYSVHPVEGGSKTLHLINRMSKQSPSSLETESLRIFLYDKGPDQTKARELFSTDIPFRKLWQKKKGGLYQ